MQSIYSNLISNLSHFYLPHSENQSDIPTVVKDVVTIMQNENKGLQDYLKTMNGSQCRLLEESPLLEGLNLICYALFVKNVKAAKQMIDCLNSDQLKTLISLKGHGGWTVVHHAAVTDKAIYKQLKQIQKVSEDKNPSLHSPSLLRRMVGLSKKSFLDKNCQIYFRPPGATQDVLMSGEALVKEHSKYFAMPPAHFTSFVTISRKNLYKFWILSRLNRVDVNHPDYVNYCNYLKDLEKSNGRENKVALRKIESTDEKQKIDLQVGMGLFARQAFQAGEIVTIYGGEISKLFPTSAYLLEFDYGVYSQYNIESNSYRSCGSCANHSFPNAIFREVVLPDSRMMVIRAITEIDEGAEICVDYGREYFSPKSTLLELRPGALKEFVRKYPLAEYLKILGEESFDKQQYEIYSGWRYILMTTPVRFLQCILRNDIPNEDAFTFETELNQIHKGNITKNSFSLLSVQVHKSSITKILVSLLNWYPLAVVEEAINLADKDPELASNVAEHMNKTSYSLVEFQDLVDRRRFNNNLAQGAKRSRISA